jgi:hypothetical protein
VLTGPKIVASTATTKRAREQVRAVYGRDLAVFPPPVLDIADTFSRQVPVTPARPGRRYLGICAHGVRLKSAEIRLAEILLIAGQTLFDAHGAAADPYMTVVGYFNAIRELAGMRCYLDDDVTTRVRSHGRRRGLSDRITSTAGMLSRFGLMVVTGQPNFPDPPSPSLEPDSAGPVDTEGSQMRKFGSVGKSAYVCGRRRGSSPTTLRRCEGTARTRRLNRKLRAC